MPHSSRLLVISYLLLGLCFVTSASAQDLSTLNTQPSTNSSGWGKGGKPKPTPTPAPAAVAPGDPDWIGGTSTTWSDATNWSPSTTPAPTDIARFTGTFSNQPNLTASASVGQLWLTGTLGQNVTISATTGSLTINGTSGTPNIGILVDNTDARTLTISAPIILGAGQTWRNSSLNVLTISGSVNNAGNTLTVDGTGTTEISSGISGSGGLIANAGTLILSGVNNYSGGTIINGGFVELKSTSALGSTSGSLTVNNGILDLNGQSISVGNFTGTAGTIWNNGNNAGSSTVTLTIGTGDAGGGNYAGIIKDNNGAAPLAKVALTKTGSGTITLSGTNAYTGVTTVDGGKLFINGDQTAATGTTTVNNSGSVLGGTGTIGGAVTLASSGAILEAGTGATGQTLTVKGALTQSTTGSILELALGASGAHSTLALTAAGTSSFYLTQHFSFIDLGTVTGTYQDIITGVTGAVVTTGWQIDNPGYVGTFTWDGANIDLTLVAVPEPSTWVAGGLAFAALLISQRRRLKKLAVRSWELGAGSWELGAGSWELRIKEP